MRVITLTTDWGNRDYYLAAFKGTLASRCPEANVIDISNDIDHFDILQASFVLKNCFWKFPEGTIHFIGVRANETRQKSRGYVLVECAGQFFIGYDNGVFSLTLEQAEKKFYPGIRVEQADYNVYSDIVDVILRLLNGERPETFCTTDTELVNVLNSRPSFDDNSIRGSVLYIDSFQNIVSNISLDLFNELSQLRNFSIVVRNHECNFKRIHLHYSDVEAGEPVCIFNERGLLEFALNGANAAGLLGVKVLDNIRVEFHGAVSLPRQEHISPSLANQFSQK